MVKSLDRKLIRDLGQLRGQIVTICLVVASGIAGYIAMQTTYRSLLHAKESYYETYRFADVFASARRVPNQVADRIRALPGVALGYTRIVEGVRLPLDQGERAATGRIISLPDTGLPPLNGLYLRQGRMPDSTRSDEALLLEEFAEVHKIKAGDRIPAIINGTLRHILITGLAMSPEYIMAIGGDILSFGPGSFAVIWMPESSVAPAFDMKGAFNDIVLKLQPGASEASVIESVDLILAPYGGFGAHGRDKQISHRFFTQELDGLEIQVTVIPLIFLAVAAFLVNVVLGRLVELQRAQVATLKALGYSNIAVGLHFLKLVCLIVLIGAVAGIGAGAWLGGVLMDLYKPFYRLPLFENYFDAEVIFISVSISLIAAVVGAFLSVRRIIAMPPAEAMRPPAPPTYEMTIVDRLAGYVLDPLGRMVLRELRRRPVRTLISALGIALAVAIMVIGRFASDSIDYLLDLHFHQSMKEDLAVNLRVPLEGRVEKSLLDLPGVFHAESIRMAPVRLRNGSISRDTVLQGLPEEGRLRSLINRDGNRVALPLDGVALTDVLADLLDVVPGDIIDVEFLEGDRRVEQILVSSTVSDMLGLQGYMRESALQQFLGGESAVSTVLLSVELDQIKETKQRLNDMPAVGGVSSPNEAMKSFRDQQAGIMLGMSIVLAFFASIIAIGIVYNNARVTLSMRSRDLASMRVLGFTRGEISTVLLGELAVQVLLALPVGMWLGTLASEALIAVDPENFRMPAVISSSTYAFAALVTIVSAVVSALLVRRKLNRLDLIGVLKTRE